MKQFLIFLVIISIAGLHLTSAAASIKKKPLFEDMFPPVEIVKCVSRLEPALHEVHQQAVRYARIDPEDISEWKKNVRKAALLPRLQFGYERRLADAVAVDIDDSVSVTSAGVVVGPTASAVDQSLNRNNNIEVNLIWYLDELLFNRDQLSISSEARAQISARRELLGEITDNYVELKRLISLYLSKFPGHKKFMGVLRIEIERMIGTIDLLTGGWFAKRFRWEDLVCETVNK